MLKMLHGASKRKETRSNPVLDATSCYFGAVEESELSQGASGDSSNGPSLEPRFVTLEEVARYLSVSTTQVYALVRSGELPGIKIGGRGFWRVDKAQLEAYVDRLHEETKQWAQAHPLSPRDTTPGT